MQSRAELLRTLIDRWEASRATSRELSPTELCREHPELESEVREGQKGCRRGIQPEAAGGHGGGHGAPAPPEGYGSEPQEAIIRDLITDELTNASDHELIQREGREKIKKQILKSIKEHTDMKVEEILFPDVTVQ